MPLLSSPLSWRNNSHRFSTIYKGYGTETFRQASSMILSGKESNRYGNWGDNAQNKSKDIRYVFITDGYNKSLQPKCVEYLHNRDVNIFTLSERKRLKIGFQIDQAGAEALIVAYLCKRGCRFRELFINGIKPHTYTAANIFRSKWRQQHPAVDEILKLPIKDVKAHPGWKALNNAIKDSDNEPMRYYYLGKKTVHGADYDMKANTFVTSVMEETDGAVNIPVQEGERFLREHHSVFPELRRDFHTGVLEIASKNNMFLRNLFGFPREFTGFWGDNTFREMYAFIPQSTVGTITNLAQEEIQFDISTGKIPNDEWGLDLLQNGHDSLFGQCWIGQENEVLKYVQPHIERDLINNDGEKFKMKSEIGIGFCWGPMSRITNNEYSYTKNPVGLREITLN